MYFENDPFIIGWLERWLQAPSSHLRWRATDLLAHLQCAGRTDWLERMALDPDPLVRRTALAVSRLEQSGLAVADIDLFSSDFMSDLQSPEYDWEWEYGLRLCAPNWIPLTVVRVWMREEDDSAARAIASLHAPPAEQTPTASSRVVMSAGEVIPVIVEKRVVNQFTRSPRNASEARRWRALGRPAPP